MTAWSSQRVSAVVVLMVVLGLLAGCSGGSEPAASSSAVPVSSTASPSASAPSTTTVAAAPYKPADLNGPAQNVPKPVKPALADEFSEKGLDTFARFWYTAYNFGVETGDTSLAGQMALSECTRCTAILTNTKDWYASGKWIIGTALTVTSTKPSFVQAANGAYQVLIQYNTAAGKYASAGTAGVDEPGSTARGDVVNAIYQNGQWRIIDIGKPI
ncbi:DUF6318 family protein [Psychromicrobium xiongbiense]|uniref:DUF6318 family protein n=1 Tax=Psychromicrobium xiongbiense TaxID=3051184 RepID=UPI0025559796|nr:DUF6318 family protein [Psychromicrobium sp. YIM S02556]